MGVILQYNLSVLLTFFAIFGNFWQFLELLSLFYVFLPYFLYFRVHLFEFQLGFYQGLKLVNIFGSLVDILAFSWQILAVSLCFLSVLLYYWPFSRIFKAIIGLFIPIYWSIVLNQQSIQSCLFSPKIFKMLI